MPSMLHRVWTEQICLVSKILHRTEKDSYSRKILEEQVFTGWEGLAREASEACSKVGLLDVREKDIPREKIVKAVM